MGFRASSPRWDTLTLSPLDDIPIPACWPRTVRGSPCNACRMKLLTTRPSFMCIRGPKVLKILATRTSTPSCNRQKLSPMPTAAGFTTAVPRGSSFQTQGPCPAHMRCVCSVIKPGICRVTPNSQEPWIPLLGGPGVNKLQKPKRQLIWARGNDGCTFFAPVNKYLFSQQASCYASLSQSLSHNVLCKLIIQ